MNARPPAWLLVAVAWCALIDGLGISLAALFARHTLVRPTTRGSATNP